MTNMTKRELINATKTRYLKASKKDKTLILDEFCKTTEYNRKYVIQIFKASYEYNKVTRVGRKGRKKIYGPNVIAIVVKIWELLDYPCGLRLKPVLIPTLEAMERNNEIVVSQSVKDKLKEISAKTLDRRLKKTRVMMGLKRNRGTTRHGSLLKSSIPIKITNWDTNEIGFMEMDTVAHNGGDPSGEFIYSLDMVGMCFGWSEQRAVLGKGSMGVIKQVNDIKISVPFNLKGLDSDSGSEFVNWHMVKYCEDNNLGFTRSRPNMKNDNAYVEQKNYTHIRNWLGYRRYDTKEQLEMINDLYTNELRLFNNFFRPVMKIKSKEKINNSVYKKRYDIAQTPYQRILNSAKISKATKEELTQIYLSLNPVQLKRNIDAKIAKIRKS